MHPVPCQLSLSFILSIFLESLMLLLHTAIPSGQFPGFWGVGAERQGPARSMLGAGLVLSTWQQTDAGQQMPEAGTLPPSPTLTHCHLS